jgi:iron-sulfur cluster assembly protein
MTESTANKVIGLSEKAAAEVKRLLNEGQPEGTGLRLGVKGGGCSGLSYLIDFGQQKEKDIVQEEEGFKVYIDPKSSLYLKDSVLEYSGGLTDRGFKFTNPNAQNTCGCGESFSI